MINLGPLANKIILGIIKNSLILNLYIYDIGKKIRYLKVSGYFTFLFQPRYDFGKNFFFRVFITFAAFDAKNNLKT